MLTFFATNDSVLSLIAKAVNASIPTEHKTAKYYEPIEYTEKDFERSVKSGPRGYFYELDEFKGRKVGLRVYQVVPAVLSTSTVWAICEDRFDFGQQSFASTYQTSNELIDGLQLIKAESEDYPDFAPSYYLDRHYTYIQGLQTTFIILDEDFSVGGASLSAWLEPCNCTITRAIGLALRTKHNCNMQDLFNAKHLTLDSAHDIRRLL